MMVKSGQRRRNCVKKDVVTVKNKKSMGLSENLFNKTKKLNNQKTEHQQKLNHA